MIVFNTIKKAEHYVRYCNNNIDYYNEGYDWSESLTLSLVVPSIPRYLSTNELADSNILYDFKYLI